MRKLNVGDIYYTVIAPLRYSHGLVAFGAEPTPEAALATLPDHWPTRPLYIEKRQIEEISEKSVLSRNLERLPPL